MANFETIYVTDVVEVLMDDETYSYGEVVSKDDRRVEVNFIAKKEEEVFAYEEQSFFIEYEAINYAVGTKNGTKMIAAWKELGFDFRSEDELLALEENESMDDDEDWDPSMEQREETDEVTEESDEEESQEESQEESPEEEF